MENREPDRYFEAERMQVCGIWGLHARRFAANEMENNEGIWLLAACFGQVQHCTGLKKSMFAVLFMRCAALDRA